MNPQKTQDTTAHLSDDDIAAALGFHTTLSEPLIKQDPGTDQTAEATQTADQSPTTTADAKDVNSPGTPPADHETTQDAEIEDIRTQLEQLQKDLQNEQNGQTTESTATAQ
jgi:hypothetical protein